MALLIATTFAFGAMASASFAADVNTDQYCGGPTTNNCSNVLGDTANGNTANGSNVAGTQQSVSSEPAGLGKQVGSLPFTGWDLMSLSAIAVALTASGLVLARLTSGRRPPV